MGLKKAHRHLFFNSSTNLSHPLSLTLSNVCAEELQVPVLLQCSSTLMQYSVTWAEKFCLFSCKELNLKLDFRGDSVCTVVMFDEEKAAFFHLPCF